MRHIRDFEEYVYSGIVKKQMPNKLRAKALIEESDTAYDILISYTKSAGVNESNANHIVKNAYDVLMERIRAKMLENGYNSSGHGAHEAEVAYLRTLGFSEPEIEFADGLRYFRNGILYYGKKLNKEYALRVLQFLEDASKRIKEKI